MLSPFHILAIFPQLLAFAPLSATLVRAAVGLAFLYVAYRILLTTREIMATRVMIVGHIHYWMLVLSASVTGLLGLLLLVGAWTQLVALIAALLALKHLLGTKWYPAIMPLSTAACLLLFVMCLSLVFTGAGAFAFDLPL